jgi:hypothetical protein
MSRRENGRTRRAFGPRGGIGATSGGAVPITPLAAYGADLSQWLVGSTVTLNVSTVSTWPDQSGNGYDGVQGTGTAQPLWTEFDALMDNQSSVTGDGANDVLTTAGLTIDLAVEDFYICAIFRQISHTSGDALSGGSGVNIPRFVQIPSSPDMRLSAFSATPNNAGAPIGTTVRGEALFSATAGLSYIKLGSTVIMGDVGTGTRTLSSLLGQAASAFFNGAVAESFIVKRAAGSGGPTAGERSDVDTTYLRPKFPSASF